jgi:hypothetical protein
MSSFWAAFAAALVAALILLTGLYLRQRQSHASERRGSRHRHRDVVTTWPPQATRVLTPTELRARALLQETMPRHLVLAQVALSRFIRVSRSKSYGEWLQRVGTLSADLLLCDEESRVLAVIDLVSDTDTESTRLRHERMARVLRAADVPVLTWNAAKLPSMAQVLDQLQALAAAGLDHNLPPPVSAPMPLMPNGAADESFGGPPRDAVVADRR